MPSISIFGIGRMGGALAIALTRAGYDVENLIHRGSGPIKRITESLAASTRITPSASETPISSDVILITTPDPEIPNAAAVLERLVENRPTVLHTSGSLSSEILNNLARQGCPTGSLHPLVSISDPVSGAAAFSGVYFCLEGVDQAREAASEIVRSLGGMPFSIAPGRKPLYHAAAVTAAGHVTALVDVAIEMLGECGVDPSTAQKVLLPLVRSTIANLETQTPSQALTGTFARADYPAFERHLNAMETSATPVDIREIYLALGERSLKLAAENGAQLGDIEKIRDGISIAKRKPE